MAQRTAFLNSDAKGFNKDFHHTWINNYMLKQPGVMFSNYSTKPEFALGNGQISGGKAIIRCTRTTGTFAGEEILACFESTSTENISTAGNKKVYIEIPEVYVNDSTAITDSLTQGANLNVGRIVSSDSYPTHSNYIKLWEITNGDWQNATDLRPEVLRRGKPNTISYFGGNGEEERIDIDNASLNKYLMSNGAGVAPSWEEGGGGGGGSSENFKRVFTADSDLLAKSMFGVALISPTSDSDDYIDFGRETVQDVFFKVVLNGETFDSVTLKLGANNSPADNVTVRIETLDSNGMPSGTLVDVGAYGTVTPSSSLGNVTVNLAGTVSGLSAHTKVAVVLSRSGSYSDSNSFRLGVINKTNIITQIYVSYEGSYSSWSGTSGCIDCDGFATEAIVQATSTNGIDCIGYCETGAVVGNDFTGILQGTVDYSGATAGTKYYLGETGTLSATGTKQVGIGLEEGVLQFVGKAVGQSLYDAIVDAGGDGDFTTISAAISAGNKSIFVKNGTYTMSSGTLSTGDFTMVGESRNGVKIDIEYGTRSGTIFTLTSDTESKANSFLFSNLTFNISYTGEYGYFIMFGGMGAGAGFLKVFNCNINVTQAVNGCNFYITGGSNNDTLIEGCRIEVYLATGSFTGVGFTGISRKSTCINSTIVVDASASLSQSVTFDGNPYGTYIGCRFLIGVDHKKSGDIAQLGCTHGLMCAYSSSNYCNLRIYGILEHCSFPSLGAYANYDSDLNTAVTSKSITIWKPNTSYSVGQYVQSGYSTGLAKCVTAHTSGTEYDNTKFEEVYGDVYISGILRDCSLTVYGTVILSGIAQYATAFVLPAVLGNIESNTITFEAMSSGIPSYCNLLVLGYRGFVNNGIIVEGTSTLHLYLGGESSMVMGNRILAYTGDIYSGGYGNIITNNTFTYVTGETTPTITQVTSGQSEIANNVIRGVADWTD